MLQQFRTATALLLVFTVLTGGIYPLVVTAIAQVVFPHAANGSLIAPTDPNLSAVGTTGSTVNRYDWTGWQQPAMNPSIPVGSQLIGQPFTKPEYLWGRLSATSPVPYHAAASSGSNYGPLHPSLKTNAEARITALQANGVQPTPIPVELVTASGSGLDPHISPAAAEFQVPRIAAARKMKQYAVRELVQRHTESRQFGVLGEPRVNVLQVNLALDRLESED